MCSIIGYVCPHNQNWSAPYIDVDGLAAGQLPFAATVQIAGSKSITNRALVIAALSSTPSVIHGALRSRDTDLMINALRALGTEINADSTYSGAPNHTLRITPRMLRGGVVQCGLAGTVMRFVPPIAALAQGSVFFEGDVEAKARPMSAVLDALRGLGVTVEGNGLPFTVNPQGPNRGNRLGDSVQEHDLPDIGGEVEIDSSASSQFVSGLLLSAPRFGRGLVLRPTGEIPSRPHVDMTLDMLRQAGVTIDEATEDTTGGPRTTFTIHPTEIKGRTWVVEPDLSNASAFLAAAAVTGGSVTVPDWPENTTQAGDRIRDILTQMGATVTFNRHADGRTSLTVVGPKPSELLGIEADMSEIGELTPTVAAIAALATTPTRLTGIAHLRGHETNRLAALTTEINRLGGRATELDDGTAIEPTALHGGLWHSYADHRMATAGAIVGLRTEGVEVENIATTAKTMPGFDLRWQAMLNVAVPSPDALAAAAEERFEGAVPGSFVRKPANRADAPGSEVTDGDDGTDGNEAGN